MLDFFSAAGKPVAARVDVWIPEPEDADRSPEEKKDIALLRLQDDLPPGVAPGRLTEQTEAPANQTFET